MVYGHHDKIKPSRWWPAALYGVFFLLALLVCLLLTAPLSVANRLLATQGVALLDSSGNLHGGQWRAISIDKQRYPLACRYQRQSGLSYRLTCDKPLLLEAQISFALGGDISIADGIVSGDLHQASSWLKLLNIPGEPGGEIGFRVDKAKLHNGSLKQLSVNGGAQGITLFNQPLLNEVSVKTLNDTWSASQPIRLETKTPKATDNSGVYLFLDTRIDGNSYSTKGELKGSGLGGYASALRFFGKQTSHDTFAIAMQGRIF